MAKHQAITGCLLQILNDVLYAGTIACHHHSINVRPGSLKAAGLVICSTPVDIKNVEPVLLPVPQCKGLRIALFVETSNVESPTQNVYRKSLHAVHISRYAAIRIHYGLSINTLRGVLVALFLTNS